MSVIDKVKNAGIVGAGGAGFPTYVKLNSKPDTYICNAAECEPLLYTDYYVIKNQITDIIKGLKIAMETTGAKNGFFAIKKKRSKLFPLIEEEIKRQKADNIKLFQLGDYYPAGDEQSLVYDVTGRIVPQKGIPIDVGVVVNNALTLAQIANAVENNVPVYQRYVSVVGEVENPFVAIVNVGTPFKALIEHAKPKEDTVLIEGGVMMGKVKTPEDVLTKTTGALVFLNKNNPAVREKTASFDSVTRFSKAACCQCTECTVLCPRHNLGHDIEPHMIMRTLNYGLDSTSHIAQAAYLCCQCGVCSMFACPFGLSPKRVYAHFRQKLKDYDIPPKEHRADPFNEAKKIPTKRLMARLSILHLDIEPEFIGEFEYSGDYIIPLTQHIGAPSIPVVEEGDKVSKGEPISKCEEKSLCVPVHSPVNGIVKKVNNNFVIIGS
ncbi:propanediol utilization protein [Thermotomaculum hydrothermale]|uniref:Propanediol utilization protein n=1 Tax=Thermotomaculum hydrothermale TaxID=981385 RepID=A0A7R6PED2_9BACT|nr:4Fe-4S dicluster domain-containing protein [Thermotomaculum hydrothermale]BBB32194.1 propanediol utilization protein [Thermotomaculum hydrothermale]